MKRHILLLFLFACCGLGFVQDDLIRQIIVKMQVFSERNYQEKVYLTTDTDVYYAGDVLWFSARLLDAQFHTRSKLSRIVHVTLYNSSGKKLFHIKTDVANGSGNGDIHLPDSLSTGTYHLCAYTEWMKNFSQNLFFNTSIYIINKMPVARNMVKEKEILDLAFFPEGGTLIESMINRIGFKVLDSKGYGVDVSGFLLDDQHDTIMAINTYKFGMGNFLLRPKSKRDYYLHVNHHGILQKYQLPPAQKKGVNLMVDTDDPENVKVNIEVARGVHNSKSRLILLSQCRGEVNYAAEGDATTKKSEVKIPKEKLDPGVNQLTLFNENGLPLAERLIFIQPDDAPALVISNLRQQYGRKQEVEIQLNTRLEADARVTISVHDRPTANAGNIETYLLLESDLKGNIEQPEFYFNTTDSAVKAADNLMLTQGWRRFVWEDVLDSTSQPLPYVAERKGIIFRGKLIDKETKKAISDTLFIMSVLDESPNFVFARPSASDELLCAFYDMHGKHNVFVNVLGKESFEKYRLLHAEEYDTFQIKLPDRQHSEVLQSLTHIETKAKDDLIYSHYRIHKPERFSPPPLHQIEDQFVLNELSIPNHRVDPDQYIPLHDLRELIYELLPAAGVRKRKGKDRIFVRKTEPMLQRTPVDFNEKPATLFLNGIPVFNDDLLFNLPYENLDEIAVYTGQYVYDEQIFYGFVSVTTKDKAAEKTLARATNSVEFEGISLKREFYSPKYEPEHSGERRTPDLRHLLYWEPNLSITKGDTTTISFYTSDVLNQFYLQIEGISSTGQTIHAIKKFSTTHRIK